MTWSILVRDPVTGALGAAVATRFFAVGALCIHVDGRVAALATQALVNPMYAVRGMPMLREGQAPDAVIADLLAADAGRQTRQLHILDASGRIAQHTGADCIAWCGHIRGTDVSVAGNMLAGPDVIARTLDAFAAAQGSLPERLLTALEAGEAAGGDKRGKQSAALKVATHDPYPDLDIRADDHPDPIAELRRLHRVSLERFAVFRRLMPGADSPCGVFDRAVIEEIVARESPPPLAGGGRGEAVAPLPPEPLPLPQGRGSSKPWRTTMRRFLLTACAAIALSHAAAAQTLRITLREDPDILDPTLARSYVGRIVFAGLCDKLFDIDEKLNIVPMLATGYEWADPKTMVIHLRLGVTFHDGTPMDAASVKYSLERHLTMQGSFRRSEIGQIDHVDVVDPATVRVVLKSPSSPFLAQLTDRAGMIVSPKAAEAEGKDFGAHPVCTGPFKFAERVANDHITLDRYPGYWNAGAIHFDRLVYQAITGTSVRLANLQAGATDLVEQIVPTDVDAVKKDPKLKLVTSPSLGYQGITINTANGPRSETPMGQKALVRQAFDLAIDRAALVQVVYNGLYTPTVQAISASSPYHAPVEPPVRDVAKAKALLKQAGVSLPVKVTMNVPNTPDIRQAAEVIQAMAAEAGFDVQINTMEFAASLQAEARGDYEAYLIGWSGRSDPDGNLYSFLHTGAGQNTGHYSNAIADGALDEARATSDVPARAALYAKMVAQLRQDLPIVYLWTPVNIVGMTVKLSGFRPVPDGMIRLQGLAFTP